MKGKIPASAGMTEEKLMKNSILAFFVLGLVQCSGSSLVATDLATSVSEFVTLTLQVVHHGTPDADGEYPEYTQEDSSRVFTNNDGVEITLTKAAIHWGHMELISDGDDESCEAGNDVELDIHTVVNLISAEDLSLIHI